MLMTFGPSHTYVSFSSNCRLWQTWQGRVLRLTCTHCITMRMETQISPPLLLPGIPTTRAADRDWTEVGNCPTAPQISCLRLIPPMCEEQKHSNCSIIVFGVIAVVVVLLLYLTMHAVIIILYVVH